MATDDDIVQQLAAEVAAKSQPMELLLRPITVFQLVAALQLTLRHPHVPPDVRHTVNTFLAAAREYFDDAPTVLDVIRRGDDPQEDR